jgi:hypothetical protein
MKWDIKLLIEFLYKQKQESNFPKSSLTAKAKPTYDSKRVQPMVHYNIKKQRTKWIGKSMFPLFSVVVNKDISGYLQSYQW